MSDHHHHVPEDKMTRRPANCTCTWSTDVSAARLGRDLKCPCHGDVPMTGRAQLGYRLYVRPPTDEEKRTLQVPFLDVLAGLDVGAPEGDRNGMVLGRFISPPLDLPDPS